MLLWAHHASLSLPDDLGLLRVVAGVDDLFAIGPSDVLVLGEPGFDFALSRVPRGALLLSWLPGIPEQARALGWRALQLSGPDPEALTRAIRHPDALVPLERGTLDVGAGVLWTADGIELLSRRECEVLEPLLRECPRTVPREALPNPDGVVRRLRSRLGASHIVTVRQEGFRFQPLAEAPAPSRALPVRRPALIGGVVIDVEGHRIVAGDRETELSAREAAALGLLLDAPGVVDRSAVAAAMGIGPDQRRALDLSILRLRRKIDPIELQTVRGRGFRLARPLADDPSQAPDPTGLLDAIEVALSASRLVTVTGPCGVGKSWLARRIAAVRGAAELDLHGVDPRLAVRLLSRRLPPGDLVLVDGLEDASALAGPLSDAIAQGRRLLVTAREPARLTTEREIRVHPWSLDALRRLDPSATEDHDGLPAALLEPDGMVRRIDAASAEVIEALAALSVLGGPFYEEDALAAGCERSPAALARAGWLCGTGPWRLWRPLRAALAARWTAADRARQARMAGKRAAAALEASPFRIEDLEACFDDLVEAHITTRDPVLAVLRADAEEELRREVGVDWLAEAFHDTDDRKLQVELLFHLSQRDEAGRLDLLRRAGALATGERRLELQLELAYYLAAEGEHDDCWAMLAEAEAVLAAQPPDAWLYCRAELAVIKSYEVTDHPSRLALISARAELLGRIEVARWTRPDLAPGHRKIQATRCRLAESLARDFAHLRRYDEAAAALQMAADAAPAPEGSPALLLEAGELAARRHRWSEADTLFQRTEEAARRYQSAGYATTALIQRALLRIRRGEPLGAEPLLARAESLPGVTGDLRGMVHYARSHQAAALGDRAGVERHAPGMGSRITVPLGEALLAVADAIDAHRQDRDTSAILDRLIALFPALAEGNPVYPEAMEELLVHADVVRPGELTHRESSTGRA